jgi:uncharacterized protein (DUF433 family)
MDSVTESIEKVHITRTLGVCGGKPCIAGTRIRVLDIYVLQELQGKNADEIIQEFPQLTMADIFAALTYLWDNRDEIVDSLREEQATSDRMKALFPSKLAERLRENVYNAPNTKSIRQVINFLVLLDACMSQDEMRNRVEFVTE